MTIIIMMMMGKKHLNCNENCVSYQADYFNYYTSRNICRYFFSFGTAPLN